MAEPDFDKTVFVIMPFGEDGTKDREQNDDTYENIIKVAVENSGLKLKCIRSDDICLPGGVMEDVITHTVKSKYVIADLSDGNPNVFYELGIRDSFDGKTILLCRKGQKLPFDLKVMRTVFYSKDLVKESSKAIEKIRIYLSNMEGSDRPIPPPVQRALGSQLERRSEEADDAARAVKASVTARASSTRFDKTIRYFLSHKGLQPRIVQDWGDDWPQDFAYYIKRDKTSVGGWSPHHVTAVRRIVSLDTERREVVLDILSLVSSRIARTTPSVLEVLLVVEQSMPEYSEVLEELGSVIEAQFTLLEPRSDARMTLAKHKSMPNQANVEKLVLTIEVFDPARAAELEARLGIIPKE